MHSPIQEYLDHLLELFTPLRDGQVATYIPELAKADPDWFAISLTTSDGRVYTAGNADQPFTIQSISKPFIYGLALEDNGRDEVLKKIGVEPTGDAFNSISLAPGTGRPLNPMINAGAIAATSLIAGHSTEDRLFRLVSVLSIYAGRQLEIDHGVFESERSTGHRNRAIGHMLRNFDIIPTDPEPALDLYFQQCSISVNCRDLSLMAATLANGGVHPISGERAVRTEYVDNMLSVMTTCGMYDYAGEWVYWVGMPAKSGVAGGILAVLPGQLGIGVFSRLDARGNSVRGVAVCKSLSRDFRLHSLRVARSSQSTIRTNYDVGRVGSKRIRREADRSLLDQKGHRVQIFELQGDLGFAGVETIVRRLVDARAEFDFAVIDFRRVAQIDESGVTILFKMMHTLADAGKHLVLSATHNLPRMVRVLQERLSAETRDGLLHLFPDLDRATEWCENWILDTNVRAEAAVRVPLAEHQMCRDLSADEVHRFEKSMELKQFKRGEFIIRKGEVADRMFLLVCGEVSITVDLPNGQLKRLSTFSAGMSFGELAFISGGARNADVRVDYPVECYVLTRAAFEELGEREPHIKIVILQNLLDNTARVIGRLNQEVVTLAG